MTWLNQDPAPLPPEPEDVPIAKEMAAAAEQPGSLALAYFAAHAPRLAVDVWGQPLPYSRVDQDRANRLWALLVSPLHRGRALQRSGAILAGEVDLLATVYPDLWQLLTTELEQAMLAGRPPFPAWAEALISTWYGVPPRVAFAKAQDSDQGKQGSGGRPRESSRAGASVPPTPADRRELAVRER